MAVSKYAGRGGYPPEKKMKVVEQWLALGNLKLVSAMLEVPYATIKEWRGQPWWQDYENELKAGRRFKVDKKLSQIIDRGLEVMNDRLENGDFVFDQIKGEVVRRPVTLKDANSAVTNLMQRQGVLESQNNDDYNKEATKSIQDQLVMLAQEFARFNGRSKANAETIEFKENENSIHEERETRLCDRGEKIHLETECSEEEGGAEQGEGLDAESWEGAQG